ncbi:MAG: MBL fold metallo-hydrolase [Bacteroidales bacterium]|nr:MBL fold metallo-hydrolase [Bacteroidales bacterium]
MDKLRFFSIGSGSSGNCYYFGNSVHGILIDAGISSKTIRKELKQIGVDFSQIMGIFVTHDHHDHIKSIGTLGEKFHIPVYATAKTHDGIDHSYGMTQKLSLSKRFLENGEEVDIGDFNVLSFPVSHDGTDNGGFFIKYMEHRIIVATDLGRINEHIYNHIPQSDIVILEANYDLEMLKNGKYPYYLKQRILSDTGHLGNQEAGLFLAENWHPELKHIYLCHLSNDNNHPELAKRTVEMCMNNKGIRTGSDVDVVPLKRSASDLVVFD